jgi:hypothetical protein
MNGQNLSLIAGAALSVGAVLAPHAAEAQTTQPVPPIAARSSGLDLMSTISMAVGVGTVTLMPRIYYSDPEATVGWKARWHISVLAPTLALTATALLIEFPVKNAIKSPRPGCTPDQTVLRFPDSGCESFGGPSTHSFGAWSAFGAGTGIWVADTFIHSDGNVHAGSIIGNIVVPLAAAVVTSVGRGVAPSGTQALENPGQIGAGVGVGIPVGFLIGLGYAALAKPNCGYGNNVICW